MGKKKDLTGYYKDFYSEVQELVQKHYDAGTPGQIKKDLEKLATKRQVDFDEALNSFKEIETKMRNDWLKTKVERPDLVTKDTKWDSISAELVKANNKNFKKLQKIINYDYLLGKKHKEVVKDVERRAGVVKHQAETWTRTAQLSAVRSSSFTDAVNAGCKKFRYTGPTAGARLFCASKVGQVFTVEEINSWNNGQLSPAYTYCGGYNCRHRLIPIWEKDKSVINTKKTEKIEAQKKNEIDSFGLPKVSKTKAEAQNYLLTAISKNIEIDTKDINIKLHPHFKSQVAIKRIDYTRSLFAEYNTKFTAKETNNRLIPNFDTGKMEINRNLTGKKSLDVSFYSPKGHAGGTDSEYDFGNKTATIEWINFGNKVNMNRKHDRAGIYCRCDKDNLEMSTITHEFGHVLYCPKIAAETEWINSGYDIKRGKADPLYDDFVKIYKDYKRELNKYEQDNDTDKFDSINIGSYGSSKCTEFLAECFTEYKLSSQPSKYAIIVGNWIDKHFKKK